MTRILYFSRTYTPHDYRFLSALAKTPHATAFLHLEPAIRTTEERPVPHGIEVLQWRGGKNPFRWRDAPMLITDLQRVIDDYQPDVIHAGPVQSAAYLAARTGFKPLVTMSWGSDLLLEADRSAGMRRRTQYTLKRTTVLAGDCQAVQLKAAEFGFPPERVVLFPWGVDLQQFTPGRSDSLRARLGWQNAFVVLSVRSWEPLYGVDVLVRGFAQAARQRPELRLLLLSGGSQGKGIREILAKENLLDRVYFAGQISQDDLRPYYQAADLYLSASHSDGSSVSLMEALACGLPALASDIPGNREWLGDTGAGWLFPDGSDQAVAQGIIQAASQREALDSMRRAARDLAVKRADWSNNFKKLLEAYDMALSLASHQVEVIS
jgi:glycosyltransferase involved in cell wall biosynthesis